MAQSPSFDVEAAHRYFAAACFNRAWDLIEKKDRTAEDDQMMLSLAFASIFHWSQRPDCTAQNMSIGYWQASRIQTLIGNASEAARLAEICLGYSQNVAPFFEAYAHEAMARALRLLGRRDEAASHLAAARERVPLVKEQADRDRLTADLADLD